MAGFIRTESCAFSAASSQVPLDAEPHAAAKPRAQSLRCRLLGSEPLGECRGADLLRAEHRFRPFGLGEHTLQEAVAMPRNCCLDAADVNDVGAQAEDHRAAPGGGKGSRGWPAFAGHDTGGIAGHDTGG